MIDVLDTRSGCPLPFPWFFPSANFSKQRSLEKVDLQVKSYHRSESGRPALIYFFYNYCYRWHLELLLHSTNFSHERNNIMLPHTNVVGYQFSAGVRFHSYGMFFSEDPLWQAGFAFQS